MLIYSAATDFTVRRWNGGGKYGPHSVIFFMGALQVVGCVTIFVIVTPSFSQLIFFTYQTHVTCLFYRLTFFFSFSQLSLFTLTYALTVRNHHYSFHDK